MSIKYNNKVIASNKTPSSYRFVGEIFQSAIPIDDPKVHLLDGSLLSDTEGYKDFIQHLSSLQTLYPQLFCTEEVWQEKVTQYGEWGQFVLSSDGVRLPKITSFVQGLNSLTDLATLIEAGLPNITSGNWIGVYANYDSTEVEGSAVRRTGYIENGGASSGNYRSSYDFDASRSSNIYGNSTTVQPQAIRYPYYIVIATGVVQNIQAIQNIEFNKPFFLGMSRYFETEPNNLSWLKSVGQWNMKSEYPDYYNWVLSNTNNSIQNFKLSTDIYTDYDFVVNITDETFRLPLLNGSEDLPSDKYDSLTLGATDTVYTAPANGWYVLSKRSGEADKMIQMVSINAERASKYASSGNQVGLISFYVAKDEQVRITYSFTGETTYFRFIYAKGAGNLYYYMGETVQNTSLINAGKIKERITRNYKEFTDLKQLPHIIETYINGTSWYRVYSDGWCEQGGILASVNRDTTTTVSLLKSYINSNYSVLITATGGARNSGQYMNGNALQSRSVSSFVMRTLDYTFGRVWEAKGYIF